MYFLRINDVLYQIRKTFPRQALTPEDISNIRKEGLYVIKSPTSMLVAEIIEEASWESDKDNFI